MNNCRTCKHWLPEEKQTLSRDPRPDWGSCNLALGYDGEASLQSTLAYAQDSERYAASLSTHETFGCVQHEEVCNGELQEIS